MIVYIAGPMTGREDFNRMAFDCAEVDLKREGHIVINPAVLPSGLAQRDYMAISISMLLRSDAIYMLKGWEDSLGAHAELAMAKKLHMSVSYEEDAFNVKS